jgi:ATP-dependent Lhr-like helicase
MANQLLMRHGVVTRDIAAIELLPGGFSALYPVLRRLEETGRIRRGYFVAGLGAAQFAQPGAVDLLRDARDAAASDATITLSATDPANPYGILIPWPIEKATRTAGSRVVLVNGQLAAWIGRGDRHLVVSLPGDEPERSHAGRALARELVRIAGHAPDGRRGWLIEEINGQAAATDASSQFLLEHGFAATSMGLQLRVAKRRAAADSEDDEPGDA